MDNERLTAVIIDDHEVMCRGLRDLLRNSDPPVDVVASGADPGLAHAGPGREADVVILDLRLQRPDPDLTVLRRLVDAGRNVVMYTNEIDLGLAKRCMLNGAMAYVTKGEVEHYLIDAVYQAATSSTFTTPTLGAAILADRDPARPALSDQERRVLVAWCGAKSMRLVGDSLGVAPSTVKTHITRIRAKYDEVGRRAATKGGLIRRALEDGLIDLDEIARDT